MDINKRVRAELRDLLAYKKKLQEEQTLFTVAVDKLREQKNELELFIATNKEKYISNIQIYKQEISFLEKQKKQITSEISDLQIAVSQTKIEKEKLIAEIQKIKTERDIAITNTAKAKEQSKLYLEKLDNIKKDYLDQVDTKYKLETELKFLQGKILLREIDYKTITEEIITLKQELNDLRKEQSRHAQWDQYLQDKENFLSEQFKLLGVKYVVYNSR